MVYISEDGKVLQTTPWGFKKVFGFFYGILYMVIMFFTTLINPNSSKESDYKRGQQPGFGPPRPPRRLGRPNTGPSVDVPFFGGCRSCAG